jgi:ferritin-like metal-binding protein YciE
MKNPNNGMPPSKQIEELLYQALETEIGGVAVYENAIRCAQNPDLKEEWEKYLEQTKNHERILRKLLASLDLDAERETAGRHVVRHHGKSLVHAMAMAQKDGTPDAAELVAAECVVMAETKDHQNWSLIGELAKGLTGKASAALAQAYDKVEDEEDEHLYHSTGWARELWLQSLGLPAVLPPPEEKKDVKTAAEAAQAKTSRKEMLGKAPPARGAR